MAFPANIFALAHAVGSNFFSLAFGGSKAMSEGLNEMIDDIAFTQTKLGTGASTPTANTVLRGDGAGTSSFGQIVSADITDGTIVNGDINASAAIAVTKIASSAGANSVLTSNGTANAFTAAPTVTTLSTTAQATIGTTLSTGSKMYPGVLNGTTGAQAFASLQTPYLNGALGANTSATVATFPIGLFYVANSSNATMGVFRSNAVATLTSISADADVQIGGADPGASSSKIWLSMSGGTLTIYNRWAASKFVTVIGIGMS